MVTMAQEVDLIVQDRLAHSQTSDRSVHLHSRADLSIEIVVDGQIYQDLSEIKDVAVRDLIWTSVDAWQTQQAESGVRGGTPAPVTGQGEPEIAGGLEKVTKERAFGARIATQLAQAGLRLTVTQYLILTAFSSVVVGALTFVLFRNFLSLLGPVCGASVPTIIVGVLKAQRLRRLEADPEWRYRSADATWALVLAALPLALGLVLLVLNPTYMSRLVTTPCGWMMTVAILSLAATAYVLLRVVL